MKKLMGLLMPGEKSKYLESSISPTLIVDKNTPAKKKKRIPKK